MRVVCVLPSFVQPAYSLGSEVLVTIQISSRKYTTFPRIATVQNTNPHPPLPEFDFTNQLQTPFTYDLKKIINNKPDLKEHYNKR